jgi:hypothetical protein
MGDKAKGIYAKFKVERLDGRDQPGEKHHQCSYFVLDISCDPHALAAVKAYGESCAEDYPMLSADLLRHAEVMAERFAEKTEPEKTDDENKTEPAAEEPGEKEEETA